MKTIIVNLERTDTGYSAFIPEFDFCGTVGDSIEEIRQNLVEAINLFLEDVPANEKESGVHDVESWDFDFRMDVSDFFLQSQHPRITAHVFLYLRLRLHQLRLCRLVQS